jgi:NADH-quinone oxidoreductase subunit A
MLESYTPILMYAGVVVGFAIANLVISDLLGRKRRAIGKDLAYESGMTPVGSARVRLSIHFYLIAVLFILFDVELIYLVPWAVTARSFAAAGVGWIVFGQVAFFVGVLVVGLIYEWRKGGLEWDR